MPKKVKKAFMEYCETCEMRNDSYLHWNISNSLEDYSSDDDSLIIKNIITINNWLIDNGVSEDEKVLMLCW